MRKWNDLLFINNEDSLFVAYQWFRDGQKLDGETKQFLYTTGQQLSSDGHEYSAWAYKADSSYVEACAQKFDAFPESAELNPGDKPQAQIAPNPVRQNMPVSIIGLEEEAVVTVYNIAGQRVAQFVGNTFPADLPVGYYVIQSSNEGVHWAGALIVE